MKKVFFALLTVVVAASVAHGQSDRLSVTGTVVNGADGNPLPLCQVRLLQDGQCRASGVSDYAGHYSLSSAAPGIYDLLITQFGDTLMLCCGIALSRDTWARCVVQPPSDVEATVAYNTPGFMQLQPVLVVGRYHMLAYTGHLITSPDDPRLWNMSGRMDHEEPRDESFFYSIYKTFYKLKAQGYDITSPFELIYPEVHTRPPTARSTTTTCGFWD